MRMTSMLIAFLAVIPSSSKADAPKVVLPDLKDPKITLVGAHVSRLADADVAAIDHQLDRHRVSLFMIPEKAYNQLALGEDPRFKLVKSRGFT